MRLMIRFELSGVAYVSMSNDRSLNLEMDVLCNTFTQDSQMSTTNGFNAYFLTVLLSKFQMDYCIRFEFGFYYVNITERCLALFPWSRSTSKFLSSLSRNSFPLHLSNCITLKALHLMKANIISGLANQSHSRNENIK